MNWERPLAGWLGPGHALIIFVVASTFLAMTASYSRRIYRLYWHPLSKFPGAKAIRIAPNELHINDTSLYKAIYKQSNPFPKHGNFYNAFGTMTPTSFTEIDRQKHKERRRMLNNMFSRAGVLKLEDLICEFLKLLENKIDRLSEKDLEFYNAFRVLTTTIILEFCFGDSGNMIEEDPHGFNSKFLEAFNVTAGSVATFRYHPWMRAVLGKIPDGVTRVLDPGVASLLDVMEFTRTCIRRWRQAHEKENDLGHRLVLDNL
ncbi:cytochrome P450 [Plectosphaerella plurivora]|uniref:Cytochrome P450 n=1 Tax=Plectosphaerella plurivora TaxID=936078 RepID=A0A9P8V9J2_9PEZI|nr:cytochrome P450 [Plectosphaerella plurivora]